MKRTALDLSATRPVSAAIVRARRSLTALLTVVLTVAACGSTQPPLSSPTTSSVPTALPPAVTAFQVEVDRLTIVGHCSGSRDDGDSAVILLHGNGGSQYGLRVVEQQLSGRAPVPTIVPAAPARAIPRRSDPVRSRTSRWRRER